MILPIDLLLLLFLLIIAVAAIWVKDLLAAIVLIGAYSFIMANVWLQMGSCDVAFTEAAVGAGASTALMMACLSRVPRWEKEMKLPAMRPLVVSGLIIALLLIALSIYVVEDLPAFGDENSPANKYMKLFTITADDQAESLTAGVLPPEIKSRIEEMGFNKEENYPTLEEGNYKIEYIEKGTWLGGRIYTEGGWDVLIHEGEIFYNEPLRYYFINEADKNLTVYRYNWPVRVNERTEEETATINAVTSGLADYRGYDTMGEETVILTGAIGVILLLRRRGRL